MLFLTEAIRRGESGKEEGERKEGKAHHAKRGLGTNTAEKGPRRDLRMGVLGRRRREKEGSFKISQNEGK